MTDLTEEEVAQRQESDGGASGVARDSKWYFGLDSEEPVEERSGQRYLGRWRVLRKKKPQTEVGGS
ncbi:hypothetical protein P5W99_35830 [Paraburkholderia sp. A3BS-1L]|uniref:hypothetical protein n=1 Tax=Paraburkholderia sp. A3BS-1L TaxID=3028375 RepID=UPI003DA86D55